jgi:hypothetical protein
MKAVFVFITISFFTQFAQAQFHNSKSRSELGVMLGGSSYLGDLNPYVPYRNMNLAGGLVYRYNIHSRLSTRVNFLYGKLEGYDSMSDDPVIVDRNLSFFTDIYELAAGVEFNYFPFQLGHDRYRGTAYLLAEIGGFYMNPKALTDGGDEVELRSLGTEGQGSSLSSRRRYGKIQMAIPIGVGCKLSLGDKASLNFEIGLRKTFTDYIDDVGADTFIDPALIAAENGPLAAEMSNRSLSGSRFGMRGNSSTKDWYLFTGAMLTFRLGQPSKCYSHQ